MSRNIWNQDEQNVEDVELPEDAAPVEGAVAPPVTEDEISQIDAQIAYFEGEPDLTATAQVMLSTLKKKRAQLG